MWKIYEFSYYFSGFILNAAFHVDMRFYAKAKEININSLPS